MKKLLLSIATPNIRTIAEPFLQTHKEYAERNGYIYQCAEETVWKDFHPSYSKVALIDKALKDGADVVIWADADVAFMRMNYDLATLLTNDYFMAAYRQLNWTAWRFLCAGLSVWKNCDQARSFVETWADWCLNGVPGVIDGERVKVHKAGDRQPLQQGAPWEQWSADALIRHTKWAGIRCCTAHEIGCFCEKIWTDGNIWAPPMPTLHFGGPSSWENRAKVFKEHYERLVIR